MKITFFYSSSQNEYFDITAKQCLDIHIIYIVTKTMTNKFENHYEIKILRNIAKELKHQIHFDERYSNSDLDSNNNNMINYWVTKRYFSEISYYFAYLYPFLDDNKNKEFSLLFNDYQEKMLKLMKEYLEKEDKSIRFLLYQ